MEQIGRYSIDRLLARGGMAEVFVGKAVGPGGFEKSVVIKRILPELAEDPAFIEMFLSEARLAAQLSHPNVVQVFDFGQHEGQYFLTMEYVRGQTLRALLRHHLNLGSPMPAPLAARIACGVCEGLQYAHDLSDESGTPLNIVHRDVAPDNIMVTSTGTPKLVDFGVAKAVSNVHRSVTGTVKGKYAYMSPDTVRGLEADRQADVYALGVTLYELVVGRRPFAAENELALAQKIVAGDAPAASAANAQVPEALSQIIALAMHPTRTERYPDARSLQRALEGWLKGIGSVVGTVELAELVETVTRVRRAAAPEAPGSRPSSSESKAPVLGLSQGGAQSQSPAATPSVRPKGEEPSQPSTAGLAQLQVLVDEEPPRRRPPVGMMVVLGVALIAVGAIGTALLLRAPATTVPSPSAVSPQAQLHPAALGANEEKPREASALPDRAPPPAPAERPIDPPTDKKPDPPKSAAPKVADSKSAAAAPNGEEGYLTLRTEPWCDVFSGTEKLGTTPLVRIPVPSGRHLLLLRNDQVGLSRKLTVTVEPGREVKQSLVVPQGSVQVEAPAGVEVWLDGVRVGTTPMPPLDVVVGTHQVRMGAVTRQVKVRAEKTEHVSP